MEGDESLGRGFSRFGQTAVDAGLVPVIKSVVATADQENYSVLAVYYGINTLTQVWKTGTTEQRGSLAKEILEHDLLPIIYNVRRLLVPCRRLTRNLRLSDWRTTHISLSGSPPRNFWPR